MAGDVEVSAAGVCGGGGSRSVGGATRRAWLTGALAAAAAGGGSVVLVRPAHATPESMRQALAAFTGGVAPREVPNGSRIRLEIAELVENGNAVPVAVSVQSPMTEAEHVRRIALFTELNPEPHVAVFHLGPHNGRAHINTRMRLATTQQVLAVTHLSDGSYWQTAMEVVVTLAACVES
jgi:sulfur-oxidizing protein SoxY